MVWGSSSGYGCAIEITSGASQKLIAEKCRPTQEVQLDVGSWKAAHLLSPPLGSLTWVLWRYDWPVMSGRHTFRVRATDGTGALQIEQPTAPHPNGATGYHAVTVSFA